MKMFPGVFYLICLSLDFFFLLTDMEAYHQFLIFGPVGFNFLFNMIFLYPLRSGVSIETLVLLWKYSINFETINSIFVTISAVTSGYWLSDTQNTWSVSNILRVFVGYCLFKWEVFHYKLFTFLPMRHLQI